MNFILNYPSYANKVIVVDILPKAYNNDYEKIFNAFSKMDLNNLKSRKQIDEYFSGFFSDYTFVSFSFKKYKSRQQWKF